MSRTTTATNNDDNVLCAKCTRIKIGGDLMSTNWTRKKWLIYHLGADSPCKLCRVLYSMFVRTPGHESFRHGIARGTTKLLSSGPSSPKYLGLSLEFLDQDNHQQTLDCSYILHPIRKDTAGHYIHNLSFNPRWVRRCLEDCDARHNCLGDVHRHANKADFHVIDVEDRCVVHAPLHCRYLALSYVWGFVKQLRLTQRNAASLMQKRSLSAQPVPRTIENALTICRSLGVRYLWVDRLCIVQDSACHSNSQVAHMHQIYSGAYMTIIAASGSDSDSGIFSPQPQLRMQHTARVDGTLYVAAPQSLDPLEKNLYSSKWNSRAWTMQECVLSRRCLVVTEHEYFLFCGSGAYFPSLKNSLLPPPNTYGSALLAHQLPFCKGGRMVHRRYARLVTLYIKRHLSFPNDILRAFEGITKILTPFFGGFHRGLPLSALRWSLCWMHCVPIKPRPGFPSWTWAGWYPSSSDEGVPLNPAEHILSFPDFNPDEFWPPCSIYHWSSPTTIEEWPSRMVLSESQRPSFHCNYLKSGNCTTCETLRWIWDIQESSEKDKSEDVYRRLLASSSPAFNQLPDANYRDVLTFRSCVASFPDQPVKTLARRQSLSAPPVLDPSLVLQEQYPSEGYRYNTNTQRYIFLGLWDHGLGFAAVVLPVHVDLQVAGTNGSAEEVVVRRAGNPCRMKAEVWFQNARNCVVHYR